MQSICDQSVAVEETALNARRNPVWQVEVDRATPEEWSGMLDGFEDANIYQTCSYGVVRWGKKNVSHLVLKRDGDVVAVAQLRMVRPTKLNFGMAYLRWGPLCHRRGTGLDAEVATGMAQALREEYAGKRRLLLQILPNAFVGTQRGALFQSAFHSFTQEASTPANLYRTFVLDLTPPLDQLRKNLDAKWRNKLTQSEKKGLKVTAGTGVDQYRIFCRMYNEMFKRKAFETTVDVEEFGKIQESLPEAQRMRILICEQAGVPVAGIVASAMGDSAIYLLGATSDDGLDSKGAYLLQWTMIQWLKGNGFKSYDLGGIDPEGNPGVYSFKKGFSGADVSQLSPFVACDNVVSSTIVRASLVAKGLVRGIGALRAVVCIPNRRQSVRSSQAVEKDVSMQNTTGFPRKFLPFLRCVRDGGQLSLSRELQVDKVGINDGTLRCVECSCEYQIEGGIARLMSDKRTRETENEIVLKDQEYEAMPEIFVPPSAGWRSEFADQIEIPPHLDAINPLDGRRVLEIACGDGRFTILMAQLGAEVLAVDFCIKALRKLNRNLSSGIAPTSYKVSPRRPPGSLAGCVGLVQADASNFRVAPGSFDRALSASPLDSRDERMAMYRSISEALKDGGRYVGGVEYDDLYRRAFGMPLVRRYSPGGVLIEHLSIPGMRLEAAPYFGRMRFRTIRAHVPLVKHGLVKRFPKLAVYVSLVVCALPGLKHLGELLLLTAERPRRLPLEGAMRPSFMGAKQIYRWYKRRKGEEPLWDPGVPI